jgi:hypothetical protein
VAFISMQPQSNHTQRGIPLALAPAVNHPGVKAEIVLLAAAIRRQHIERRDANSQSRTEVVVERRSETQIKDGPVVVQA